MKRSYYPIIINILLLLVALLITFMYGYSYGKAVERDNKKDYQAACILSDICRNMVDNIGNDADEIYHEYIDNIDCYNLTVTKEDMDKYYWCY